MGPSARMGPVDRAWTSRRTAVAVGALVAKAVGLVTVLLVLNYALGAGWDAMTGRRVDGGRPAVASDAIRIDARDPAHQTCDASTSRVVDPRAHLRAMAGDRWATEYFRELRCAPSQYWPYVSLRNTDYRSRYLNQLDGARRSYRPVLPPRHPTLWFYGGSTAWGEGQRDGFTIASDVARLAAADGLPVAVTNYGVRGLASPSEALAFANDLASHPAPDLAVFYDGWNDCSAAQDGARAGHPGEPWLLLLGKVRDRLGSADPRPSAQGRGIGVGGLWADYRRHSLVHRLARNLHDVFAAAPAGAAPSEPTASGASALDTRCASIYRRSRTVESLLARAHGVDVMSFWQPVRWPVNGQRHYRDVTARLVGPPTVNLADVLDGVRDVYLDGGHTNERGAELVAVALYRRLRPRLVEWYRADG